MSGQKPKLDQPKPFSGMRVLMAVAIGCASAVGGGRSRKKYRGQKNPAYVCADGIVDPALPY